MMRVKQGPYYMPLPTNILIFEIIKLLEAYDPSSAVPIPSAAYDFSYQERKENRAPG